MSNNGNTSKEKNSIESIKKVIKNIKDNETPSKSYNESLSIKESNSKIESLHSNSINNQSNNANEANKKDNAKTEGNFGGNNQNIQSIDSNKNEDTKSNTWFFEKYLDDKFKSIDTKLGDVSQEMNILNAEMKNLNNGMINPFTSPEGSHSQYTRY